MRMWHDIKGMMTRVKSSNLLSCFKIKKLVNYKTRKKLIFVKSNSINGINNVV